MSGTCVSNFPLSTEDTADGMSADYDPVVDQIPPPVYVNRFLLEHSHTHVFMYCLGCFGGSMAELTHGNINHIVISGVPSVSPPVAGGSRLLGVPKSKNFPRPLWQDEVSWKALLREFSLRVEFPSDPPWKMSHFVLSRAKVKATALSLHSTLVIAQSSTWLA